METIGYVYNVSYTSRIPLCVHHIINDYQNDNSHQEKNYKILEPEDDYPGPYCGYDKAKFSPNDISKLSKIIFQDGTFDEKYPEDSVFSSGENTVGKNFYDIYLKKTTLDPKIVKVLDKQFYGIVYSKEFINPQNFVWMGHSACCSIYDCHVIKVTDKTCLIQFDYDNESG